MQNRDSAGHWTAKAARLVPFSLILFVSASSLVVQAQEEAGAAQKPAAGSVKPQAATRAIPASSQAQPATPVNSTALPAAPTAPPASTFPPASAPAAGTAAAGLSVPLRNIDLLNRMDDDRLPTRPRRLLKLRFTQVRQAKDEKILQLLLICVGFVGVFVAILALRSVPPSRGAPK